MMDDEDEGLVSFDDAARVGFKVVEMADRVGRMNKAVPGSVARWGLTIDGKRYEVTVTVAADG